MKNETNQFKEMLMWTPIALMLLLSSQAFSQDKEPSVTRGPSVVNTEYEGDPEIQLSSQDDKEEDFTQTISPAEREILEAEARREGREVNWAQIAQDNAITISGENERDGDVVTTETETNIDEEVLTTEIETETVESLKKKLAEKTQELESLRASIDDGSVNTSEEIERLNQIILSAEREISTLSSQISDLTIETELAVADKEALEAKVLVVEIEIEELKALLAEREVKIAALEAEKLALEEEKEALTAQTIKLKEEKAQLETVTCEQEDRLAKLEELISASTSAPDIMAAMMMQQQQMMMSMMMMMNSGFPMTQAPSLSNGNDNLNMMMMMQSMQQESRMTNFQNGIYGLFGAMNSTTPTYQIAGDYFNGGAYSIMNQGQGFGQQQQQNPMMMNQPMVAQPFSYNMNRSISSGTNGVFTDSGSNSGTDTSGSNGVQDGTTTNPDLSEGELKDAQDAGMV